jgi:hypothetical protein
VLALRRAPGARSLSAVLGLTTNILTVPRNALLPFVNAVREAALHQNWVAALVTALALPDVCGWLEDPGRSSRARYAAWFEQFAQDAYTGILGGRPRKKHIFLSGTDCYALRCALLHEGTTSTDRQRARRALRKFRFITPPAAESGYGLYQDGSLLVLRVDDFCEAVCKGVEDWVQESLIPGSLVEARTLELLRVEGPDALSR